MNSAPNAGIVLIGMPGVGKSTVGVILAKLKGMRFIDTDLVIQEESGHLLSEIIERDGIDGFLALEDRIAASVDARDAVVATGGSVVFGETAMQHLSAQGTIVFIDCAFEELERRLGSLKNRGVVLREGQDLRAIYEERTPLYRAYADICVDETGRDVEETVHAIDEKTEGAGYGVLR